MTAARFLCAACGTQYPDAEAPPERCPVCEDERQFVPPGGQSWTTLDALRAGHSNAWRMLGPNLFGAALAGRTARWVGNLDAPHTPLFIGDFARGLATLGERPEALGAVWHIPTAPPLTGREFVHLVFEEAGRPPKVGAIGRAAIVALGLVSPVAREGVELLYQFEAPYVIDSDKFARTFGGAATPHRDGIRRTLAWYRQRAAAGAIPPSWRNLLRQGRPARQG